MNGEIGRCVHVLRARDGSPVYAVAWSPDSRWLASGSNDRSVRVWDADTGQERRRLDGHTDDVNSMSWSPDGRWLASGSDDQTVRVWDLDSGQQRLRLDGYTNDVMSVSWSPDGRWLASGSWDHTVRVWDVDTGQEHRRLDGHTQTVMSVSWSPDGRWLASGSGDHTVRVWDADSGQERRWPDGHTDYVRSVSWSPDGRWLASGSYDRTVRVWDADTGQELRRLDGHTEWVMSVSWSPDGRWLASGSFDHTVWVWDPDAGRERCRLDGHTDAVWSVSWSEDGRWLASGSWDHTVRVWDADSGREVAQFTSEEDYAWRLAWAPDAAFLASSYQGDVFRLWDTRGLLPSRPVPVRSAPPLRELAALPPALAALQGMGLHPPISLLRDLLRLTAGLAVDGPAADLAVQPGLRKLAALRWPAAARVGLAAWLLRRVPLHDWQPPSGLGPAQLRDHLAAALAGEPITPQAPEPPLVPLQQAAAGVDDRFLTLLATLGPRAVAADPALVVRLARKLPGLPALAESRRRLLGLRLEPDGGGVAQGRGPGAERAGVQRRGDLRALVPSQLALPEAVLQARQVRGELLYRARSGREPPRLRPAVLMLDVSPGSFGPVESITRLAAHVLAGTLVEARLPVWLVTAGGAGSVALLEQPADLVELWTRRTLEPPRPARALAVARALRAGLVGQGAWEPVIVLLAQAYFGAEEDELMPPGVMPGLRGLFVHHVGQGGPPAWSMHCERWVAVGVGEGSGLGVVLGELLA
jgi:WD40 repeat protein